MFVVIQYSFLDSWIYFFFWVFVLFSHSFWKQRKQFLSPCMNMLTFNTNQIILRHEQNRRVIFISPKTPIHILCFVISTFSSEKYFLIILSFLKLLFGKQWVKDAVCKQTELNMKDRWSGLCSSDVLRSYPSPEHKHYGKLPHLPCAFSAAGTISPLNSLHNLIASKCTKTQKEDILSVMHLKDYFSLNLNSIENRHSFPKPLS